MAQLQLCNHHENQKKEIYAMKNFVEKISHKYRRI